MKTNIYLCVLIIFMSGSFVFANVPPPARPKEQTIKVSKNYSDYVFYLCRYKGSVDWENDEQGHVKVESVDIEKDTFEVLPLTLTVKTPFNLRSEDLREPAYLHLVAVRKGVNEQIKPVLNEKLMSVITSQKDEPGIYAAYVFPGSKQCWGDSSCRDNFIFEIRIESLDKNGLRLTGTDKSSNPKKNVKIGFAAIFLALGITFSGMWVLRRSRRKSRPLTP